MARRTKKASKRRTNKRTAKKVTKKAAAASVPAGMSTAELAAELQRRQRSLGKLEAKRDRLLQQVAEIEQEITALGGSAGGAAVPDGRRRPRNAQSLGDVLPKVLSGKQLSIEEIMEAVRVTGYTSTSANFRVIVNQHLIKHPKIKRVGRGVYTAK